MYKQPTTNDHRLIAICGPTATGKTTLGIKLAKKFNGELVSADSRQVYKGMDIGTGKDLPDNSRFISSNIILFPSSTLSFRPIRQLAEKACLPAGRPESILIKKSPQSFCHSDPPAGGEESHNHLRHSGLLARRSFSVVGSRIKELYSLGYYLLDSIPLWLLDIVPPNQPFSVAEYEKLAWIVIKDIWTRGKLPILVGGTGLYIKAVIDGLETTGIPQNWKLRKKLDKLSLPDLQNTLKSQNPPKWNSMNSSDQKNPRRLIRAIEITHSQGDSQGDTLAARSRGDALAATVIQRRSVKASPCYQKNQRLSTNDYRPLLIGLTAPNKFLYQKIDDRVEKRVKQGIVNEIKSLLQKGYSWDLPSMSGLGYRVWKDYFEKSKTLEETIQIWKYEEHAYCRRQLTWFKKDQRIKWFDIDKPKITDSIYQEVKLFLSSS